MSRQENLARFLGNGADIVTGIDRVVGTASDDIDSGFGCDNDACINNARTRCDACLLSHWCMQERSWILLQQCTALQMQ